MNPATLARASALLVPAALGGGLLLTSTVSLSDSAWTFDVKRMLELAFVPLLFSLAWAQPALRVACAHHLRRTPRWLAGVLLAALALGIISSVHNARGTMSLLYSLADVTLLALLAVGLYAVAAARVVAGTDFDRLATLLLALVGVAVGLQELIGVTAALASGLEFHPRIALMHFSWPRFYNQVQTWSMPVIAAMPLVFPGRPLARLLAIAALALNWYVLIATGARGSTLAVAVAVPVMIALLPAARRHLAVNHVAGLAAGALLYGAVVYGHAALPQTGATGAAPLSAISAAPPPTSSAVPPTPADSTIAREREKSGDFMAPLALERMKTSSGRVRIWKNTLTEAARRPWLGNGPMNYACRGPVYREGHPHNFVLQWLHEWGAPATMLMLLALSFIAWRTLTRLLALQRRQDPNAAIAGAVGTAFLAALLLALLDGVFVMPASQAVGLLVAGWLLGLTAGNVHPDPASPSQWVVHVVLLAAFTASVAVYAFARHEFAAQAAQLERTEVMDRLIPRFWQNGKACKLYQEPTEQSE